MPISQKITRRALFVAVVWLIFRHFRNHRRWYHGLLQTMQSMLGDMLRLKSPHTFHNMKREEIEYKDGESAPVYWPAEQPNPSSKHVWVVLPGGMRNGDSFYMRDSVEAGLFEGHNWCVFHNPGIMTPVRGRPPPGLVEVTYIEQFLQLLHDRGYTTSLCGFSAGSMLAIQMAARAEATGLPLACVTAIHGPDKIRWVFEHMGRSLLRLDILFSFSLYITMLRSGIDKFHPAGAKALRSSYAPYLSGWDFMKTLTETVFHQSWDDMEENLWSCRQAMQKKMKVPIFRILAKNDPIIDLEACVDPSLFENLDRVRVMEGGGHVAAFYHHPELAIEIKEWSAGHIERALEVRGKAEV